jgi:hypothetical protein
MIRLARAPIDGILPEFWQLGGSAFAIRAKDGHDTGGRIFTLPTANNPLRVLAPRGFGRPLLATGTEGAWKDMHGKSCAPERWLDIGGVAAIYPGPEADESERAFLEDLAYPYGIRPVLSGFPGSLVPDCVGDVWAAEPDPEIGFAAGSRVARWKGPPMPDVDGLTRTIHHLVSMVDATTPGTIRVGLHGTKGFCFFRVNAADPKAVAVEACQHLFEVGPLQAASVAVVVDL